jgi:hypothetical protein
MAPLARRLDRILNTTSSISSFSVLPVRQSLTLSGQGGLRGVRSEVWPMWCCREDKQLSRFTAGSSPVSDPTAIGIPLLQVGSSLNNVLQDPDHA